MGRVGILMKKWLCFSALCFSASSLTAEVLETVDVYGRSQSLIGDSVSASQGVVNKKDMQLRPIMRTGDILEFVPGMVVTQHSGTGKANQYFLRGFNLDHGTDFSTHFDGMPINMRTHGHGQGYTDLNFIIPEVVGQLNYKKGGYYADVGDFSGAGAAKFSSLKHVDNNLLELSLGENDYFRFLSLASINLGVGQLLAAFEYNEYAGPWVDIKEDLSKKNVFLKYQQDTFSLSLMAYDNGWNSADQIPGRAVKQGVIDQFGSIDKSVGGESSRYSVNAQWDDEIWKANAYWLRYEMDLWSNFTYFLDDPINGDQFNQYDKRDIVGANGTYHWSSNYLNKEFKNTLGVNIRYDLIDDVALHKTNKRQRIGTVRSDSVDQLSVGIFAETKIALGAQLDAVFGARYDYYDFTVDSNIQKNYFDYDLSANSGDRSDGLFSTKGSLIYRFLDEWETYVSIGQGFHSNDARGTTIKIDPLSGDVAKRVDPLVRSLSYEWGLRGFYTERLNTSLALWFLELDSELLFVGDAGNTEESGATERYGLEFTAYYHLNDQWMLDMEYAWTEASFKNKQAHGKNIPGAVGQVIQAGITAQLSGAWQASLRYRYYDKRPLNESGSVKSDDAQMLNAKLSYQQKTWYVDLSLLNVLDSDDHDVSYLYESQLPSEADAVEDIHYHVFEPRSVRVAIGYKF